LDWVYRYNLNNTLALVHYKTQFNFGSLSILKHHLTLALILLKTEFKLSNFGSDLFGKTQ
jgi:hypothetical protein